MKIGIIGCGTISGAYFEGARKTDILEIKACADLRMEAAHAQAEKYNCDARAVDEYLHHTHAAGALSQGVDSLPGPDVTNHGESLASAPAHLLRHPREGLLPSPRKNHAAAFPGQRHGHGPADAASRTRDERQLVRQ